MCELQMTTSRREFLALTAAFLLAPRRVLAAGAAVRRGSFAADVGILYSMLNVRLQGALEETVDRDGGRYEVMVAGQGDGIASRIESRGVLRDGRWMPLAGAAWFQVRGRESRTQ